MAEEKELSLSDLGLEDDETPAEKAQKQSVTGAVSTPDNKINIVTPEKNENLKEYPEEMEKALKKRNIPRPPREGEASKPKNTVKRGGTDAKATESNDGYTVVNINDIAKNPISKPKDPVRDTMNHMYDLADKGIERTKKELSAPGGRIDVAKHKYIDHNYSVLANRAKTNEGLQNHIKAVNDLINSDARFDGITEYERKAYILYKVAKDNETGITDESFGIKNNKPFVRQSSADVGKNIDRMIKNRQQDDDDYLLDDNKAFILDDGGSNFAFKDDPPPNNKKKEEEFMENEKVINETITEDISNNDHLEMKSEPETIKPAEPVKENKPVEKKSEPAKATESIKQVEAVKENKPVEKPTEKKEEVKPTEPAKPVTKPVEKKAEPVKQTETTKPAVQKPKTEIVEAEILTAENPEDDKSAMIEEDPTPEDEVLENEKRQKNQKEFAQSVISMLDLDNNHDLDGFAISESINLNTAISSQKRAPLTVKWGLQYTGTAFEMTPFSGEEIIQFSSDNTDFTSISGLRTIFSNIYRHLIIPNKPSFEAWLKQTSDYDVESLFFGIYISCFKDNNFLTYECPNKSCGKIYIEKRKIEDMVVYPNKETEERFKQILKGDTVTSKLYRTRPVPISDKYAIGFVTQSIWSNLFEPTALSKETANQYSTVVNLMPQIDRIYLIDRENKRLSPINFGVVNQNLSATVLRKVKGLNQIFRTFTMDERTKAFIEINKITSSFNNDRIRYQIPESTCPKCGTKIPAVTHTPLDLLFIRSQLPIAAVSMQELV